MRLGERQKLKIVKKQEFGVYLSDIAKDNDSNVDDERVLLPLKQVPENVKIGDEIEVFIYRDSKDRLIATTSQPQLSLGRTAVLRVADVGKIGAFIEWGLEKDLLLPFREQTYRVSPGDDVLTALYIDKSNRLAATMKVYHYLESKAPYKAGDDVEGLIYEVSDNFGAFVAIDMRYSALIPKKEFHRQAKAGDKIRARVTRVLEDGRLNLSIRDKGIVQIESDAQTVLEAIEQFGGVLPFSDKAAPEVIERELHMSKNAFKRAAGHLYKEGLVKIEEHCIKFIK